MKKVYYLLLGVLLSFSLVSCSVNDEFSTISPDNGIDYSYVLQNFDLWEVDHSRTTGPTNASVPFLDRAITISFIRNILYANNNFSGFGYTGNGYGIDVASYNLGYNTVTINHDVYGRYTLDIIYIANDEIRLYDRDQRITYTLYGYYKNNYNYDSVFYNNIEYFLQEFKAWRKINTIGGYPNAFDDENFLGFETSGNVFYSSVDNTNISVNNIFWDYSGIYTISNTNNYKRKVLSLNYGPDGIEKFELTHVNDSTIDLYHLSSGTTYRFQGDGYIQFLRPQYKTLRESKN